MIYGPFAALQRTLSLQFNYILYDSDFLTQCSYVNLVGADTRLKKQARSTMISQLFLSGHLGRGKDLTPTPDDAHWTTELCAKHDVTGLTIYSDGDFLSILEGKPDATMAVMEGIGQDPRIETVKIVLNEEKPVREFSQFSIGFRGVDYSKENKQSFRLTLESLAQSLPDEPSAPLKSLTHVFARVHNLSNVRNR